MFEYRIIKLKEKPALKDKAANWFHQKWGIPQSAYIESMEAWDVNSIPDKKLSSGHAAICEHRIKASIGER